MQPFTMETVGLTAEDWRIVATAFDRAFETPVAAARTGSSWLQRVWNTLRRAAPAARQPDELNVLYSFLAESRFQRRPAYDLLPALHAQGFTSEQIGALAALAIH